MHVYKGTAELSECPPSAVVTIGNFDGVHLGHRDLLAQTRAHAARIGGTPVVITFRPHPQLVIRPGAADFLINTYEEKLELLGQAGAEAVLELEFSREFSNISPADFVDEFLGKALGAKALYLGYDFAFGKERAGSVEVLRELAAARGIEIQVRPAVTVDHEPVSSSGIRKALDEGRLDFVNHCLGRPFFLRGLVWRGEGRGRTIGVPTANLRTENRRYPRVGVYATRTSWRGQWYKSVSNVGYNPTFKGEGTELPLKIETHLFDFNQDMYGDEIQVEFFRFLRPEKKFSGVQELLAQMQRDFAEARR